MSKYLGNRSSESVEVCGAPIEGQFPTTTTVPSTTPGHSTWAKMGAYQLNRDMEWDPLVPNGDFGAFTKGSAFPPDGWSMQTGTWDTHATRTDSILSGKYSVYFTNNAANATALDSAMCVCQGGMLIECGAEFYVDSPGAPTVTVTMDVLFLEDDGTTAVSTINAFTKTPAAATTIEYPRTVIEVPATARFFKVRLRRDSSDEEVYWDRAWVRRARPSFEVYGSADTSIAGSSTEQVKFDNEQFDYGGNYDSATNYRFVAPVDGVYHFDASAELLSVTDARAVVLTLKLGGATVVASDARYASVTGAALSPKVSKTMQLTAGSYVEVFIQNGDTGAKTLSTGRDKTYFCGFQLS